MSLILPSIGGGIIASPTAPPFSNTYSVDFDGTDDYIDLGTSSSLNPTSALTVSAWVRADTHNATAGTYDAIYTSSKDAGGANTGFVLTATQNKWYCFYYSGTTWYSVLSDSNLVTGQWYHLASTWDGSTAKLYVNGSVQTSTLSLSSISYSTATSAKIGSYYTGNYLDGLIDEVSLFDSALSASDVATIYNSGIPNDISSLSPLGWWRMGDNDSGSGTTITDQGSGGNNGTLTNGPTFSTSVPYVLPSKTNTYSVELDGTNDYIDVGASSDFSFGTGAFTMSQWFKADVIAGGGNNYYTLFDFRGSGSDIAPTLYMSQQTGYRLYAYNGSTVVNYNTTPSVGQWYHVAYTRSGTTGTIYLNGSNVASGTDSANYSMSNPSPRIGAPPSGVTGQYVDGKIDEVAIFNSALSASDITAMYNNGTPNDISSLNPVGWWRMGDNDGATGITITDQGSGGNDATLINGPTFSTDVPS